MTYCYCILNQCLSQFMSGIMTLIYFSSKFIVISFDSLLKRFSRSFIIFTKLFLKKTIKDLVQNGYIKHIFLS